MMIVHNQASPFAAGPVLRSILFAAAMSTCTMPTATYADPTIAMPAHDGCISLSKATITALNSEFDGLTKEILILETFVVRIQAALDESRDDTDLIEDVVSLFVDEPPNQGLVELMKLVQTELANRMTRLKVLQAQLDQAAEDLQDCERRLQSQTRFGKSETRLGPDVRYAPAPPYMKSLASSSGDTTVSFGPGSGIGLGDGGTP